MMMSMQQAAAAVGGQCHGGEATFSSVSIDTRTLAANALYIAIVGEQFDGHQFTAVAQSQGASCVMVESIQKIDIPQLVVQNCRLALGRLACYWREQLRIHVAGITGSNGKTTVKEMTASILAQKGQVYATKGNLNNDYGVPLTLLALRPEHDFAVVEMGANHPGEIAYLTALAKPDVALVNNAGSAHLAGFGDVRGVAEAKGEIYSGLTDDGVAVINRDDDYAEYWAELCGTKKIFDFSLDNLATVSAEWKMVPLGSQLQVVTPQGSFDCFLPMPGEHNVRNALAATAVALALNVEIQYIKTGLQAMRPVKGRLQHCEAKKGARLIDDTYNANPNSFKAAIELLASYPGKRILVMGDMAELGDDALTLHQNVGRQAQKASIDVLYATGEMSQAAVDCFAGAGQHFSTQKAMIETLQGELAEGVTVLVKGSRSMMMERVVSALSTEESN